MCEMTNTSTRPPHASIRQGSVPRPAEVPVPAFTTETVRASAIGPENEPTLSENEEFDMGERQDESSTLMRAKRGTGVRRCWRSQRLRPWHWLDAKGRSASPSRRRTLSLRPQPRRRPRRCRVRGNERSTNETIRATSCPRPRPSSLSPRRERDERKDANGTTIHAGNSAGSVSVAGDTVTKTYFDDETPMEVAKDFLLTGNSLFIHHWSSDHLEDSSTSLREWETFQYRELVYATGYLADSVRLGRRRR